MFIILYFCHEILHPNRLCVLFSCHSLLPPLLSPHLCDSDSLWTSLCCCTWSPFSPAANQTHISTCYAVLAKLSRQLHWYTSSPLTFLVSYSLCSLVTWFSVCLRISCPPSATLASALHTLIDHIRYSLITRNTASLWTLLSPCLPATLQILPACFLPACQSVHQPVHLPLWLTSGQPPPGLCFPPSTIRSNFYNKSNKVLPVPTSLRAGNKNVTGRGQTMYIFPYTV